MLIKIIVGCSFTVLHVTDTPGYFELTLLTLFHGSGIKKKICLMHICSSRLHCSLDEGACRADKNTVAIFINNNNNNLVIT